MAFCSNCGSEASGRFCSSCGAPLEQVESVQKGKEQSTYNSVKELFALRACLSSAISLYDDATSRQHNYETQIEAIQTQIQSERAKIAEFEQDLASKREEVEQYISAKQDELKNAESDFLQHRKQIRSNTIVDVVVGVGNTLILITSLFSFFTGGSGFGIMGLVLIGVLSGMYLYAILFGNKEIMAAKKVNRRYRKARKNIPLVIADVEVKWKSKYATLRQRYDQKIQMINKHIADLETQLQNLAQALKQEIAPLCDTSVALFGLIENEFSTHLSVRDWHHLDSIIFCMLTGRAETIKEALVLVDAQQPDATKMNLEIQEDLRGFARENATQIARVADHLDYRLSRCYDETTEAGKAQIAEIAPYISPEAIKKALIERVRISSVVLMERIAWMRERAK